MIVEHGTLFSSKEKHISTELRINMKTGAGANFADVIEHEAQR